MKLTANLRCHSYRSLCAILSTALLSTVLNAQPAAPPLPSPPATASVTVAGGTIDIHYNTPHMRGRKIMGECPSSQTSAPCPFLVPYGKVWRTGANPATTLMTSVPLKFGNLLVPAGTHTIYSLPSPDVWQLIINNQTGQWGLTYNQDQDLGRIPMKAKPMTAPQEVMSLTFENTTANSTELHIRWETTDRYVIITKP
ncbi:MAG: DUF2911 domain-containing protein [Acidobacteriaceae bacterium]|jgi:hypothetical protein